LATQGLTESSRRAIVACVRSIEEFEILVYLARNRDRYCSVESVAAEIALPAHVVARGVEALASRSLLDVRIAGAVLYKLDPASDASAACVDEMLAAARRNRAAVLRAILTEGHSPVEEDFEPDYRA
jgi:hypothetical protein